MADSLTHLYYSTALRQSIPILIQEYPIPPKVEQLATDLFSNHFIAHIDWQSVHETVLTEDKIPELIERVISKNSGGRIVSAFEYLKKYFADDDYCDISRKLQKTLEVVKELPLPTENDIMTLTSKLLADSSEMLKSVCKVVEYIEGDARQGKRPSIRVRSTSMCSTGSAHSCTGSTTTEKYQSKLIAACTQDDAKTVQQIFTKCPSIINLPVNQKDETLLMVACESGNINVVKQLLQCDMIDVNAKDADGRTAMMYAMLGGNLDVISALFDCDAVDRDAVDNEGFPAEWYIFGQDIVRHLALLMLLLKNAVKMKGLSPDMELDFRMCIDNMIAIQKKLDWCKIRKIVAFLLRTDRVNHADLLRACMAIGDSDTLVMVLESGKVEVTKDVQNYAYAVITSVNPNITKVLVDSRIIDIGVVDVETIMECVIRTCPHLCAYMVGLIRARGLKVNKALETVLLLHSVDADALPMLLDMNTFDLNRKDREGSSVFLVCCKYGSCQMVHAILQRKDVDFNTRNNNNQSSFMLGLMNRNKNVAKLLFRNPGIHIETNDCDNAQLSNLMYASMSGNIDIVQSILFDQNVDINAKNVNGNTVLVQEIIRGMPFIYSLLLNGDSDDHLDPSCIAKITTVMYSNDDHHSEQTDIISLLLQYKGIDVNATNNGWSALMCACAGDNIVVVSSMLRTKDINVNAVNVHGFSALMIACFYGTENVAFQILEVDGVDINVTSKNGLTALTLASYRGSANIVSRLISMEVKVNRKDNYGNHAIQWAKTNGHEDVVTMLEHYQYQQMITHAWKYNCLVRFTTSQQSKRFPSFSSKYTTLDHLTLLAQCPTFVRKTT